MKKLIFIVMILFTAGFAFSQQNPTARNVVDQEGITNRPSPPLGQLSVDSPGPSLADDPEVKAKLQKNEDYFNEFQDKFKTLRTFNNTKQQRDDFKAMQTLVERQKKLVDYKMEEIQILERAGKTVPIGDFTQLKDLLNRYHSMTVNLNNWVNKIQ
jgi:hypothetical protein